MSWPLRKSPIWANGDSLKSFGGNGLTLPQDLPTAAAIAYRTLIEQIPAATPLSRLDAAASTIFISPQIEAMTGYSSDEWIADRALWAKLLHPDDRARMLAANAEHTSSGRPFSQEYRLIARDGRTVWVREESRVFKDERGRPVGSQGIIVDISEGKRVEGELVHSLEDRGRLAKMLKGARAETGIDALLAALNARDGYTSEHSRSVVDLVETVARRLQLSDDEIRTARQVALLHDIGKLGVPDSVLRKPGPLDANEWRPMREHPIIGARIVESIPGLEHLGPAIRAEHERWDGKGYPDGLSGDEIPIVSRITFVCDAYHAMISNRPYRKAMSEPRARLELRSKGSSQFDAGVVDALLAVLHEDGAPRSEIDLEVPPIRVILVDDDASTRMLLQFSLESDAIFGVIGEAGDGSEALAMVRSEQPDAVVIDLAMPVMGGLEAIPKIKQLSAGTKIVVFTASDSPGIFENAVALGADACLGKAISLTEVNRTLRTLCELRAHLPPGP
jgi:PAS domain S-box-containing protein